MAVDLISDVMLTCLPELKVNKYHITITIFKKIEMNKNKINRMEIITENLNIY